ncbi:tryptophan halogenase family protein [Niveispirillum sp. KHB5.9]|uniref:tryptophan halogenase family protein n=1 Tax=Niveispirillum sp. KHB5.9 TaxID=3400269 RepID=UPI003A897899
MAQRLRIVVVGGGTAGWMMASGLSRLLPSDQYDLTLIESDEIGTVGVGEATLPHIKQFNDRLGIDEAEFMRATGATIKLGIEFVGWNNPTDRYIHPFGAFGEPWAGVDFQHHWARARLAGIDAGSLQDYCYAIELCRANAFELPDADTASIRSTYSYAYHFDAGLYAGFLRGWATRRGAKRIEGRITDVHRDAETGHVRSLTLKSGESVEGDFFVDCSGFRSLLVGGACQVPWCDWSEWLPCDRALAVPSDRVEPLTPFTRATAAKAGWTWRIPLQHRIGNGYVFSSRWCGEEEAHDTLMAALDGPAQMEPRLLRFAAGRWARAWAGNCLAVGLASGFLEPLESTSIFLIQAALFDLVELMPRAGGIDPRLPAEFNRLFAIHYDRVRDFLVLHYMANSRHGEPLWDHVRTMPLPDSLMHKLELFREGAVAPGYKLGLFSRDSWLSVFEGQGVMPGDYARLADRLPLAELEKRLSDLRTRIRDGVVGVPSHGDFIKRHCAARDAAGQGEAA